MASRTPEIRHAVINSPDSWRADGGELPFKFASNEDAKLAAAFINKGLEDGERTIKERDEVTAQRDEAVALLRALMAGPSGGVKSCGHDFDCVCASENARAFLAKLDGKGAA